MKKMPLLLLASSLLILTACRSNQETKPRATASASSSQQVGRSASTSQSSSAQTKPSSQTTTASSSAIATQASQTESQPALPSNEALYATTLHLVRTDTTPGRATHYAFVDSDGNGTAELLTGHLLNGQVSPAALYYLKHGVPTYLARVYVAGAGGGRESFIIYQDSTVETVAWHSASGQGTATLYQLTADNSGVLVLGEADVDMRVTGNPNPSQFGSGRTAIAFESLDWQAFD